MQVTVTIPDELAAQAEAHGLKIESYIEYLLARQPQAKQAAGVAARLVDLEDFFSEMAVNSHKIPDLPEEAFTRECFY